MTRHLLLSALALASVPALAANPGIDDRFAEAANQTHLVDEGFRPLGLQMPVSEQESARQQTTMIFAPGGPALPVFLNRWGGTYFGGWNDSSTNHSSIVPGQQATLGDFDGTDAQWNSVLTCVQDLFEPFNVYVTDVEPVDGEYVEAVVGGSPDQIGLPWGVGGVAPYDPFTCNVISNAVVYAFADVYGTSQWGLRSLCETVAQEVAHAFTLDHELLCEDPMTYLDGCGEKTFQDEYATCGEWEPRECSCNRPSQNSVQLMYELIGPSDGTAPPPPPDDNENPEVTILRPGDGDTLLANSTIEVVATASDDVGLVSVELDWIYNDITLPCPGEGGGWSCSRSGDTYTWRLEVSEGSRSFRARARDVVGNVVETEVREVWLSEDLGEGIPDDELPPEVTLISPRDGDTLTSNDTVTVVATATDDTGIAVVGLIWEFTDQIFPCPYESQAVTCTQNGSTYVWDIRVGNGSRTFSFGARDLVGNEAITESRTISLSAAPPEGPVDDEFEMNDTFDFAVPTTCATGLDLHLAEGDDDWFVVDAPEGSRVRVALSGPVAGDLDIAAFDGPSSGDRFADGDGAPAVVFSAPAEPARVQVSGAVSGAYSLRVSCLPADYEPFEMPPVEVTSCKCVEVEVAPPASLAGLVLIGLVATRRRRRR